jgi:trans-2,3-dihydro-3-hydroxyanthranilate isomerase
VTPPGPTLGYWVVDVFTDRAFAGNPLAVVLDTDGLPTQALAALAREFNLSETSFPQRADDGADYALRIFTPAVELPFAGHPSVGAAWVLRQLGRIPAGRVVQSCGAGRLPLEVDDDGATLTGGEPTAGPPLDPAPLLAAVGLDPADLAGPAPRTCGTGLEFAYLLVRDDAVARAVPDPVRLAALTGVGGGVSVVAWRDGAAHARVFAGGVGVVEDPATGSAALGLGVHLATSGLLPDGTTAYEVTQGVEMGRPSILSCEVDVESGRVTRETVRGGVVLIARGEVARPA